MTKDDFKFRAGSRCSYRGMELEILAIHYSGTEGHIGMVFAKNPQTGEDYFLRHDNEFDDIQPPVEAQQEFKIGDKVTIISTVTGENIYGNLDQDLLDTDAVVITCPDLGGEVYIKDFKDDFWWVSNNQIKLTKDVYKDEKANDSARFAKIELGSFGGYVNAEPPSIPECNHEDKYINSAGGTRFWYCRKCGSDLGDV